MREDETIDLDNDEVRIYLTSSQQHFQEDDDSQGKHTFEQRRNHRTQLIIYTNDVNGDDQVDSASQTHSTGTSTQGAGSKPTYFSLFGSAQTTAWNQSTSGTIASTHGINGAAGDVHLPLGPLPYVYKTYSTVGGNVPNQQSPLGNADGTVLSDTGAFLQMVCPVCTHPAYCVMYDGTAHPLVSGTSSGVNDAAACGTNTSYLFGGVDGLPSNHPTGGGCTGLSGTTNAPPNAPTAGNGRRIIPGSTVSFTGLPAGHPYQNRPTFQGCYQVKVSYAPVMDDCAFDPSVVVSDLNPLDFTARGCRKKQQGFTIYDGLMPRQAGGSHPLAVGWSYESPVPLVHTMPGNSDFRIDEIGDQMLRTRADPRPLCRYSNCPELTVNGGDQQPESKNFLYPAYSCSPTSSQTGGNGNSVAVACQSSWRGDLSSSAQLVFDSTNWNIAQTVKVVARGDDVFEPAVDNRGQDAYVHHFVVAQDINLAHTYYDDIEVNDLTVSIKDDDPAVVIESLNDVSPTEGLGEKESAEIKLRLASEPMYPVTVYLQSGKFFDEKKYPGQNGPVCTSTAGSTHKCNFKPDDEQVIFQDKYQYETCWTTASKVRTYTYPLVRDQPKSYRATANDLDHGGTFNYEGCFEDENGDYVLVDAPIDLRVPSPSTRQIPATMQCHGDDRCTLKDVPLPNGAYPRDNFHESRVATVQTSKCQIASCSLVQAAYDEVGHFVSTSQETGKQNATLHGPAGASPVGQAGSTTTISGGTAMRTCKNDGTYLTLRSYSSSGMSNLPTTGYTCNSYVTFSTTNWNTWQALKVIGVDDNMDEGAYRISQIGFLYESIDWYYNSPGADLITRTSLQYSVVEDAGNVKTTVPLSMFDTRFGKHINRYPRISTSEDLTAPYSGADQKYLNTATNKANWISKTTSVTRPWETIPWAANQYTDSNGGSGAYYGSPATWGGPCHGNADCVRSNPFQLYKSADNLVCCCEVPGASSNGYLSYVKGTSDGTDGYSVAPAFDQNDGFATSGISALSAASVGAAWQPKSVGVSGVDGYISYNLISTNTGSVTAEDPLQVQKFDPAEYDNRNVQCGAIVTVGDDDTKGVTISRSACEATEGRRFWFDTFQQEPTPMECDMQGRLYSFAKDGTTKQAPMDITLGLFTAERVNAAWNDNTNPDNSNLYMAPSYASFSATIAATTASIGSALPSSGTIQGELGDLCVQSKSKTACAALATGPSCSSAVTMSSTSETEKRWACESAGGIFTTGNTLWSSANGGTCYQAGLSAQACAAAGGTFEASNNAITVNTGRVYNSSTGSSAAPGATSTSYSTITCPSINADGWTMSDWPDAEYRGMTAPVCPYTISLDAAPLEGSTVVVHLREDFELSNLQDHELYFYEEASYRPGVYSQQCTPALYPGSSWVNGGCFIHNVPVDSNSIPVPRGSTDLDVMFTDADWNVPRRITVIALNDDVDEPTQIRTVYHTVGGCTGKNHNNDEKCVEDPTYTGIAVSSVDVIVVDDDIMDLVVIADDGYVCKSGAYDAATKKCTASEPNVIDESFIGSYDAAGPRLELTVNYWYQSFERQGPYAEDGISGSNFQGRSTNHSDGRGKIWAIDTTNYNWVPAVAAFCHVAGNVASTTTATSEAECLIANGNTDSATTVWVPSVPAKCCKDCGTNNEVVSGALDRDACLAATGGDLSAWPVIDPGNDGGLYSSGAATVPDAFTFSGHGSQIKNDGIGAGGYRLQSRTGTGSECDGIETTYAGKECETNRIDDTLAGYTSITGGYITDNEDPLCLDPDPMKQDDRCFRIDNQPWTSYDPYWDIYTTGGVPYDSQSPRNTYDQCTPVGQPSTADSTTDGTALKSDQGVFCKPGRNAHKQPNRGFKGIGPAYTEPEDEFAVTVHSRECRGDTLFDGPATWSQGTQTQGANAYRAAPGTPEIGAYSEASTAATDHDCVYGSFKVRLNSSPGTKHVRRRYVGESATVLEEELVQIVITPDVTAQTMFDPVSVTFTHTGATLPNGDETYRWDEPALFKVVPVDDEVDERAGVVIDFTSFSITQSHIGDGYWGYTNSYQADANAALTHSIGARADAHTAFRHHIRTIHTKDNDYAGITVESGMSQAGFKSKQDALIAGKAWGAATGNTSSSGNVNYNSHEPVQITVTEGETFAYYTLRLDTQPRKVQRQTGTNPNTPVNAFTHAQRQSDRMDYRHNIPGGRVAFSDRSLHTALPDTAVVCNSNSEAACTATDGCIWAPIPPTISTPINFATATHSCVQAKDPAGMYHEKHYGMVDCDWEDYSDVTRPAQCGSIEPEQGYWVDVTVTQSIQVDLAEPQSCPNSPPWGGGRNPTTVEHPRFPFNAGCVGNGASCTLPRHWNPINELKQTADHLTKYLTTCGGWQRDATYRFTANNWNVPQYVYLYAHNDKDGARSDPSSGPGGGNDNSGNYWRLTNVAGVNQGTDQQSGAAGAPVNATIGQAVLQTLKHYVETQDTLDNMNNASGYVQRNKHGATYTSGNKERYPFGVLTDFTAGNSTGRTRTTSTNQPLTGVGSTQEAILTEPFGHRVTGFTTYGYSDYQQIYGYYEQEHTWTGVHIGRKPCGAVHMGAGIGHAQVDGYVAGVARDDPSNDGDEYVWKYATTDSSDTLQYNGVVLPKATASAVAVGTGAASGVGWVNGFVASVNGEACLDPYDNQKPYTQGGEPCIPINSNATAHPINAGNAANRGLSGPAAVNSAFVRPLPVRATPGPNKAQVPPSGLPGGPSAFIQGSDYTAETAWPTLNTASDASSNANSNSVTSINTGIENTFCVPKYATQNGGMKNEPADVRVIVHDNDALAGQLAITPCRQTSLFSTSALESTSGNAPVAGGNQWLVDQNCQNGDAGGLPGYPVVTPLHGSNKPYVVGSEARVPTIGVGGDAHIAGNAQCIGQATGPYCSDCPVGMKVDPTVGCV
jgi:hypothetical protein